MTTLLMEELKRRNVITDDPILPTRSTAEKQMEEEVSKIIQNLKIDAEITSNEYIFGLFESDLLIKFKNKSDESGALRVLNIEVDGSSHGYKHAMRFGKLRDQYLKSRGVEVERISTHDLWKDVGNTTQARLTVLLSGSSPVSGSGSGTNVPPASV